MTIPQFMTKEFTVPAITDKFKNKNDMDGYTFKIMKVDLDDAGDVLLMQEIITRGLTTDEVAIVGRSSFTFMSSYFAILEWMEKNPD